MGTGAMAFRSPATTENRSLAGTRSVRGAVRGTRAAGRRSVGTSNLTFSFLPPFSFQLPTSHRFTSASRPALASNLPEGAKATAVTGRLCP